MDAKIFHRNENNAKVIFPEMNATLRTDVAFDEMQQEEHHKGPSPLTGALFLNNCGLHETVCHLRADNCSGQNKNNAML